MKLHVIGVPHTITRKQDFSTCAFTQKVVNLCAMMHRRGHEVIHYGVEGSVVEATESVDIVTHAEWAAHYGARKPFENYDISMDGPRAAYMELYKNRLRWALEKRVAKEPFTEIICLTWNGPQKDGAAGINQFQVETGIGYEHTWSDYRVYESYAWMHMQLGKAGLQQGGKWYWWVIPNAFDVADFPARAAAPDELTNDFLYMGRLNDDKGIPLAVDVCKRIGAKLTLVGQGDPKRFLEGNPHVTYHEPVAGLDRARMLNAHRAVFTPSIYVEPFCGVHVEAMLCGTPVITTDWGVFSETILHGANGYRCRSFEQMIWAAKNIDDLTMTEDQLRNHAIFNYSLERVSLMYEECFQAVLNLKFKDGFYTENPKRTQLDFLIKATPGVGQVQLDVELVIPEHPVVKHGWEADQDWERDWWGLHWAPHWDDEIRKQKGYFRMIDSPQLQVGDKSVLDIGCGPVSQLQRCAHGEGCRGVDPLAVSPETLQRYVDTDVEFLNVKAEEMPVDKQFDEIWMYNTLQHTDSPPEIFKRLLACTKVGSAVRIFEWIDLGVCPGHPQNLTEAMFAEVFGGDDFEKHIWNVGFLRDFGGSFENKYIAIHAVRKR